MFRGTSLIEVPTPIGLTQVPRHSTTAGSNGGGCSYEPGTPVGLRLASREQGMVRGHLPKSVLVHREVLCGKSEGNLAAISDCVFELLTCTGSPRS